MGGFKAGDSKPPADYDHVSSLDDLLARKAHPTADLLDWSHSLVHLAVLKAKGLFW